MTTNVDTTNVATTIAGTLDELAQLANEEHQQCEAALRDGLRHAIRAGEYLTKAKALCAHGEWLPWLREHFEGSERLAQAYMRVGRDPQRVAGLSLRDALKQLSEPKDAEPTGPKIEDGDAWFADFRRRCDDVRVRFEAAVLLPASPEALRSVADCARDFRALTAEAIEYRLRAERRLGEVLNEAGGERVLRARYAAYLTFIGELERLGVKVTTTALEFPDDLTGDDWTKVGEILHAYVPAVSVGAA